MSPGYSQRSSYCKDELYHVCGGCGHQFCRPKIVLTNYGDSLQPIRMFPSKSTKLTTKENYQLSKAIASHCCDNGIEARTLHIPIDFPAIIHSFTITMPLLRGHIKGIFRRSHGGEHIYPDTVVEIETETDNLPCSTETLPRIMPVYPSSSQSRTISSSTKSSSDILRSTRKQPLCLC